MIIFFDFIVYVLHIYKVYTKIKIADFFNIVTKLNKQLLQKIWLEVQHLESKIHRA